MSEKWTKGPWEHDNRGSYVWQTEGKKDGCMVASVRGWGYLTGLASPGKVPEHEAIEIMDANGCLIAAAPEMYEALKAIEWIKEKDGEPAFCPICRHYVHGGHSNECKLGAALKKARGEE